MMVAETVFRIHDHFGATVPSILDGSGGTTHAGDHTAPARTKERNTQ